MIPGKPMLHRELPGPMANEALTLCWWAVRRSAKGRPRRRLMDPLELFRWLRVTSFLPWPRPVPGSSTLPFAKSIHPGAGGNRAAL